MRHRRSRSATLVDWPPTLRQLVRAAELECPPGHAQTLRDLTVLALRKVPSRGIFDPAVRGEDELFTAIESVARAHLELTEARASWRSALDVAALPLERRDEIERTAVEVQSISETAYFYTGLAFGLAFVTLCRGG
jgi:hypothetical protein